MIVSDNIRNHIRKVFSQFGGAGMSYNPFAPGGLSFGVQGNRGIGSINRYYETPLDQNLKRLNDPTLNNDQLSIEKRLEIYHNSVENDLKGYTVRDGDLKQLKESDAKLNQEKIKSTPPKQTKKPEKQVAFEVLLEAARKNSGEKHPFEDDSPPTIKPSRRHTMSQLYTNRNTGTGVFNPVPENERSPYNKARYTTPPDGNPRYYPNDMDFKSGRGVERMLDKGGPGDVDFYNLYGESLAFDHPQEPEIEAATGHKTDEILNRFIKKQQQVGGTEAGLEAARLPDGPGKPRNMYDYFAGTKGQEIMGVADKFPSSPAKAVGLQNWPFSSK